MEIFFLILVRIQVYLEIGSPFGGIGLDKVGSGWVGFDGRWYGSNNYSAEDDHCDLKLISALY